MKYNSIIIVGPTACGKTGLSIDLAKSLNAEIVGADSLQIYKDYNIGTAKITEEEKSGIKHHMIDFLDPNATYSVSEYKKDAMQALEDIMKRNVVPIIVGGTGFYIDALIGNNLYGECPANADIREKYNNIATKQGKEYLYSILLEKDPETAKKLHYNDIKRVVRALEILECTGKTKSELELINRAQQNTSILKPLIIGLNLSTRDKLYAKINKRVDIMFDLGLEKEINNLLSKGVKTDAQGFQAIGYKEFIPYLEGNITLEQLKDLIKINTRHYAKRQLTYFKKLNINKWYNTDIMTNEEIIKDVLSTFNC